MSFAICQFEAAAAAAAAVVCQCGASCCFYVMALRFDRDLLQQAAYTRTTLIMFRRLLFSTLLLTLAVDLLMPSQLIDLDKSGILMKLRRPPKV